MDIKVSQVIYSEHKRDQCIVRSYVKGYTNLIYHTYCTQNPVNMLIKLSYMYTCVWVCVCYLVCGIVIDFLITRHIKFRLLRIFYAATNSFTCF